jgi:signal transduction histidine kinase/ActR/RegA family two-component response regulator
VKRGLSDIWQRFGSMALPPDIEALGPDARRRAELALILSALATPVVLVRVVLLLAGGVFAEAAVAGVALVVLPGLLAGFRHTRSLSLLGNGVATLYFGGISFVAYTRGGVGSPAAVALGLTPLFATFIAGWRSGVFWALAAVAAAAAFAFLAPALPDLYPAEAQDAFDLLGVAVFAALVMIATVAFERSKNAALAAQRQAEQEKLRAWEEARMLRADRMASVGQLVASVAHEINTPLGYVMANLAFLEARLPQLGARGPGQEQARLAEAVAESVAGTARVASIVRDLKAFVRVDEDADTPLDLRAVMDMAARMASNELRQRARLVQEYTEVPPVRGSETRMAQVFLNLLINAAQAIPQDGAGEHTVTVTIAAAGDVVVVEVRDTGVGIPADILPRVTEPFFTTKAVGVGTGLGLAVCKNIVERHRGTLEIASEIDRGTCVRVILPRADGAAGVGDTPGAVTGAVPGAALDAAPAEASGHASGHAHASPAWHGVNAGVAPAHRVLLVDDDPALGRALQRALRAHELVCVSSGREALARLQADPAYDVVLCDLMMPGMTGMELYEHLEALGLAVRQRVVFLTGGAFTARARAFLERVPNRAVQKPVLPEELEAIFAELTRAGAPERASL